MTVPAPSPDVSPRMVRRVIMSSFVGSVIEWYDFYLYGVAAAVVFDRVFFPQLSTGVGLIASFGTLAAGFLARPLGGVVLGHFGDRIGRKPILIGTLVSMGLCTALIGLLPTYAQVGVLAPLLLVVLRVVQGVSAGGEWGGAMLMTWEYSPEGRRGLTASINPMGTFAGLILANGAVALFALMPDDRFLSWGWRIPFLVSALLVALGIWLRRNVDESPVFAQLADRPAAIARVPILEVFRSHSRVAVLGTLIMLGPFTASAIFNGVATAYALQLDFTRSTVLTATLLSAAVALVLQPVFGALSDRIGRRPLAITGTCLLAVAAFAVFPLINSGSVALLVLALCLCTTAHAVGFTPIGAWLLELFPAGIRFSGASLVYQVAGTVGGGLTPLVAASIFAAAGGPPHYVGVALLMAGASVLAALAAAAAPDHSRAAPRRTT